MTPGEWVMLITGLVAGFGLGIAFVSFRGGADAKETDAEIERLTQIALAAERLISEAWPLQEQFNPETYEVTAYRLRRLADLIETE